MTSEMRDWGGYAVIREEARVMAEEDIARPLVDCPRCGYLLVFNERGIGSCPMGHFRTSYPGEGHERQ